MTRFKSDAGGQRRPNSVRNYCAVSVDQTQGQIRNPDTRKPSRLKFSDFDWQTPHSKSGQNPDSADVWFKKTQFWGDLSLELILTQFIIGPSPDSELTRQQNPGLQKLPIHLKIGHSFCLARNPDCPGDLFETNLCPSFAHFEIIYQIKFVKWSIVFVQSSMRFLSHMIF